MMPALQWHRTTLDDLALLEHRDPVYIFAILLSLSSCVNIIFSTCHEWVWMWELFSTSAQGELWFSVCIQMPYKASLNFYYFYLYRKKWYFSKAKEQELFVIFPMRKRSKKQLVSHAHPVVASSHLCITYKPWATSSQSWAVAKRLCKEHRSVRKLPVCCDCNKKMWLVGISHA